MRRRADARAPSFRSRDQAKITAKGDELRELKKTTKDKAALQPLIDALTALKAEKAALTGEVVEDKSKDKKAKAKDKAPKEQPAPKQAKPNPKAAAKPPPPPPTQATAGKSGAKSANGQLLAELEKALAMRSYVSGFTPSAADKARFDELASDPLAQDASAYPNVARWLGHIGTFSPAEQAAWK